MIHELRSYAIVVDGGGVRELERRFGNGIEVRLKYSSLGGFFHTLTGDMSQVVHIWPYEGLRNRAEQRHAANLDESNRWPPGIGELFEKQEVEILLPAPFMRPLAAQTLGRLWELSWVDYTPGRIDQALAAYEKALPARENHYPVTGCWTVDVGASIGRIYLLEPFKDPAHRDQVREAVAKDLAWPPRDVPGLSRGSKLLEPAGFSPLQ